jgi:hypothetical protein
MKIDMKLFWLLITGILLILFSIYAASMAGYNFGRLAPFLKQEGLYQSDPLNCGALGNECSIKGLSEWVTCINASCYQK